MKRNPHPIRSDSPKKGRERKFSKELHDSPRIEKLKFTPWPEVNSLNNVSFSSLNLPPGVAKLISKKLNRTSQSQDCVQYKPTSIPADLLKLKQMGVTILVSVCPCKELSGYRLKKKLVKQLCQRHGIQWISTNLSPNHYNSIASSSYTSNWSYRGMRAARCAMKALSKAIANATPENPCSVAFFEAPSLEDNQFIIPCFLSCFLKIYHNIPVEMTLSQMASDIPPVLARSNDLVEGMQKFSKSGLQKEKEKREKIQKNIKTKRTIHTVAVILGSTYSKDPEKDEYKWRLYLKPHTLGGSWKENLWFIRNVSFNIPSDDSPPVVVKRPPYEFEGQSWGTLVVEVSIHFRIKRPPLRLEHELDFSGIEESNEQIHLIEFQHLAKHQRPVEPNTLKDPSPPIITSDSEVPSIKIPDKPLPKPPQLNSPIQVNSNCKPLVIPASNINAVGALPFPSITPIALPTVQPLDFTKFTTSASLKSHFQKASDYTPHEVSTPVKESYSSLSQEGSYCYLFAPKELQSEEDSDEDYDSDDGDQDGVVAFEEYEEDDEEMDVLSEEEAQMLIEAFAKHHMEQFAQIFISNAVRLDCLAFLNEADLILMGVPESAHSQILGALKHISFSLTRGEHFKNDQFTSTITYREISYKEIEMEARHFSEGFYGIVYRGIWRGQSVAVKKVKAVLDNSTIEEFRREAAIMERLNNHPAIAFFIGICTEPEHLCMITKYYPKGSAFDIFFVEKLTVETKLKVKILMEAASGVMHIHREGLIHCDIAARNILVDEDWSGRICDFGLSRVVKRAVPKANPSLSGPLRWMAPELLMDSGKHSRESDAWSFGVTMWEILMQEKPYSNLSRSQVEKFVKEGHTLPTGSFSIPLKSLMDDCFNLNPLKRPSFSQIWKRLYTYYTSLN